MERKLQTYLGSCRFNQRQIDPNMMDNSLTIPLRRVCLDELIFIGFFIYLKNKKSVKVKLYLEKLKI